MKRQFTYMVPFVQYRYSRLEPDFMAYQAMMRHGLPVAFNNGTLAPIDGRIFVTMQPDRTMVYTWVSE